MAIMMVTEHSHIYSKNDPLFSKRYDVYYESGRHRIYYAYNVPSTVEKFMKDKDEKNWREVK